MSEESVEEQLSAKRYVTLVLRLLVNGKGQLVQGEVVTLEAQSLSRFTKWRELTQAVRAAIPR